MKEEDFFENQTLSSWIKANIVSEYFPSYCKIISRRARHDEIRFIDLFSGPGVYNDGNASTPILVARKCEKDGFLKQNVRFIFNDKNPNYIESLVKNFKTEFPSGTFDKPPRFLNRVVGDDDEIRRSLLKNNHVNGKNKFPSLLFFDPFGYKGIETEVLVKFLNNWGNEIFLFLNTKRINAALDNDKFDELMKELFPNNLEKVRVDRKYESSVRDRLFLIKENLGAEFEKGLGAKIYYTAFQFEEEDIGATSHFIMHFTKHPRGFDLVKTIYNDFANVGTFFDGKNTYTFDVKKINNPVAELFDVNKANIDQLKQDILKDFKGETVTAYELFERQQASNLFTRSHYSKALRELEEEDKLISKFTDNKNHRVSVLISKDCKLKFK